MSYNIIPLIPAYEPDEKLTKYVDELIKNGFDKLIIVNDGSSEKCEKYFNELKNKKQCIVIEHEKNKGKGQALKTGFNYYLKKLKNYYNGVVTADSDGQHSVKDTINIAIEIEKNKNKRALILGVRDFNKDDVPFKSKFGNKITKVIFKILYGKSISDTQTGLRGFTNKYIEDCLKISGDRYEYETNMLIHATRNKVEIIENIIDTIYIDDNQTSHFHPIRDSFKIYKLLFMSFIKFSCSGIISFLIDWGLFVILSNVVFKIIDQNINIIISTIIARIISSLINFLLNKNIVFNVKEKENTKVLIVKYYSLCLTQMLMSAGLVVILNNIIPISKNIIKIIVDLLLFFISYKVQQNFIFVNKRREKK